MKTSSWLALLLAPCAVTAFAAPPTLQQIIQPDSATMVVMSPGGDYLAVGTRVEDRVMAAILDRKTMQVVRGLDPEKNGEIAQLAWVSPRRLFVVSARVGSVVKEAYLDSAIVAINVDGTQRDSLYTNVLSTIRNDDDHILINVCGKGNSKGCSSERHHEEGLLLLYVFKGRCRLGEGKPGSDGAHGVHCVLNGLCAKRNRK